MNRIDLTGLRADLALGAMAAFGTLRVCERSEPLKGSRLSWQAQGSGYHAVLWTPSHFTREQLVAALLSDISNAPQRPELNWSDQIKTAAVLEFRTHAQQAISSAALDDRALCDWLAAFGNDLVLDEGKLEPTPFDMSVARQKFLADARKLATGLVESGSKRAGRIPQDCYAEALFGPWLYRDDQHSLGWDPSTMKLGAFTYKAPTGMPNAGVKAAVWLAFESLPLFPCYGGRRLQTRAFRPRGREVFLYWPVWEQPVTVPALATLLGLEELADPEKASVLRARGVRAVFRSAVYKPNKYLTSFRNAELVFAAQSPVAM